MPFYVRETQTVDNKSSTREKKRPGVRERNIDSRHTYMFTLYLYGWVCVCLCVCVCVYNITRQRASSFRFFNSLEETVHIKEMSPSIFFSFFFFCCRSRRMSHSKGTIYVRIFSYNS